MRYPNTFLKLTVGLAVCAATLLVPAHAAPVSGQGTWETTLQGRDLDGNASNGFEAFYDTVLDITWLADANFAQNSGYDDDGRMNWNAARAWAAQLNINGFSSWRLPNIIDTGTTGCNYSYAGGTDCGFNVQTVDADTGQVFSEMAHMYQETLGNKPFYTSGSGASNQPGWGLSNTGPFDGLQARAYWTNLPYAPDAFFSWSYGNFDGNQGTTGRAAELLAWAVRDGDIAAVPEPTTYALTLAGLAVLLAARRRAHR